MGETLDLEAVLYLSLAFSEPGFSGVNPLTSMPQQVPRDSQGVLPPLCGSDTHGGSGALGRG